MDKCRPGAESTRHQLRPFKATPACLIILTEKKEREQRYVETRKGSGGLGSTMNIVMNQLISGNRCASLGTQAAQAFSGGECKQASRLLVVRQKREQPPWVGAEIQLIQFTPRISLSLLHDRPLHIGKAYSIGKMYSQNSSLCLVVSPSNQSLPLPEFKLSVLQFLALNLV